MSDLVDDELKIKLKNNLYYALCHKQNPSLKIQFVFSGKHMGKDFRYVEKISYFAGGFTYKNVYFDSCIVDKDTILSIIVNNFHVDKFSFIDCIKHIGDVQCHGHGEYWGEDIFSFIYKRLDYYE